MALLREVWSHMTHNYQELILFRIILYIYISIDDLGDVVRSSHTGRKYEVMELGRLQPHQVPLDSLLADPSICIRLHLSMTSTISILGFISYSIYFYISTHSLFYCTIHHSHLFIIYSSIYLLITLSIYSLIHYPYTIHQCTPLIL